MNSELEKGRVDAMIGIEKNEKGVLLINLKTTKASPERGSVFTMMLNEIIDKQNLAMTKSEIPVAELKEEVVEGRKFKTIDFILPGQLGFSLLSAGVFGTAFIFHQFKTDTCHKKIFRNTDKESLHYTW